MYCWGGTVACLAKITTLKAPDVQPFFAFAASCHHVLMVTWHNLQPLMPCEQHVYISAHHAQIPIFGKHFKHQDGLSNPSSSATKNPSQCPEKYQFLPILRTQPLVPPCHPSRTQRCAEDPAIRFKTGKCLGLRNYWPWLLVMINHY